MSEGKYGRVRELLLANRGEAHWPWLSELEGRPADKRSANKFLLGSIVDFQVRADEAWENARRFAEGILDDPRDLWERIAEIPQATWDSKWKEYSLHQRFHWAHKRIWRIANDTVRIYQGDARKIWDGQDTDRALLRLRNLISGEQVPRMIIGALIDTGQMFGTTHLKADLHVRRVLGRVFEGEMISPGEADQHANAMLPGNSWILDRPLYQLLECEPDPSCSECYLRQECVYNGKRVG